MDPQHSAPTLHVRPRRGWLNDPNGLVRHGDRWHVFYQHNPAAARHGDIHWGHHSSPDLLAWTEHPVAFGPQPGGPDRGGCWSGSSYPWAPGPAVVYTGIVDGPQGSTVCVRVAADDTLERWGDPVVVATEPDVDGILMMRDPVPFAWRGRRYALLGAGLDGGLAAVLLFDCSDPTRWAYAGVWLDGDDPVAGPLAPADIWECPQLVALGEEYALVLSLQTEGRLEDVTCLLGDLVEDPQHPGRPRFVARSGSRLDRGTHLYAPQVVADGANDPLLLGWVMQDDAPEEVADRAVAGCLTFPRRLSLEGDTLVVRADPALAGLVGDPFPLQLTPAQHPGDPWWGSAPLPARVRVTVAGEPAAAPGTVVLATDAGEHALAVTADGLEIWLDGEVAEAYRPHDVASTLRSPGCATWSLRGDVAPERLTAHLLVLPAPAQPS